MTNEVITISIRAYADTLKISDKAVRNAIKDGVIKKGVTYSTKMRKGVEIEVPGIIQKIADKEFGFKHKTGKIMPGQNKVNKIVEQEKEPDKKSKEKSKTSPHDDADNENEPADLTEEDEALISSMKVTASLKYAEATRRREIIALVMDKRKLQQLEGSLIRKEDVEKVLFLVGVDLKKALLNLPARITPAILGAVNEVESQNIITIEITNILEQYANMDNINLK